MSPDENYLLAGTLDASRRLLDLKKGRIIRTMRAPDPETSAFMPAGKFAALLGEGKSIHLLKTRNPIATGQGHRAVFSHDWKFVLAGTVRLLDVRTGRERLRMANFQDGAWLALTPEGHYTASPGGERRLNARIRNRVLGLDRFAAKYHRPDLVQRALSAGE